MPAPVPVPVPEPVPVPVPVILDGALGTELMKQVGYARTEAGAANLIERNPEKVAEIHREHADAGAQILTTATLCAHVGDPDTTRELATKAVALARSAADAQAPSIAIAGAIGPHPAPPARARAAYADLAAALVAADVDVLLLETMTDPEHAAAAVNAAHDVADGRPVWLAIACGPDARLLGGATIDALLGTVDTAKLRALLVNCTELEALGPSLHALAPHRRADLWLGAYPNTGRTLDGRHDPSAHDPATLVAPLVELARVHALDLLGGCCGTDPAFIAGLRAAVHPDPRTRARAQARLRGALAR